MLKNRFYLISGLIATILIIYLFFIYGFILIFDCSGDNCYYTNNGCGYYNKSTPLKSKHQYHDDLRNGVCQ